MLISGPQLQENKGGVFSEPEECGLGTSKGLRGGAMGTEDGFPETAQRSWVVLEFIK